MGEEALIYLIVQALIAAKAMYFERLRQDPTLLPKV